MPERLAGRAVATLVFRERDQISELALQLLLALTVMHERLARERALKPRLVAHDA